MQNTTHLLMIEPVGFAFNAATAVNNSYQKDTGVGTQEQALKEFQAFVQLLRDNEIDVTVVKDTLTPATPDSIFPNNWISFHDDEVYLYPMFAENRRQERKATVLNVIKEKFVVERTNDLTEYEKQQQFLEGTGSMVLDREHKIAYACLSPRTNETVLNEFCTKAGYSAVVFSAKDHTGLAIYHTNVLLCIADRFAVICLAAITDSKERELLIDTLIKTNKTIIDITTEQLQHFAGNMLQVKNADGELLLIMSAQAHASLTKEQVAVLESFNRLLFSPLYTIETAGGGSARCMMAEVFLSPK